MSIDAAELRKNNWLQGASISISKFGMFSDGKTQITSYGIYMIDANPEISKQYSPIPLTPEILIACGFSNDNYGIFYIRLNKENSLWCKRIGRRESWEFCVGETFGTLSGIHDYKYLHQAQNCFFALTGKELIYSPIK